MSSTDKALERLTFKREQVINDLAELADENNYGLVMSLCQTLEAIDKAIRSI